MSHPSHVYQKNVFSSLSSVHYRGETHEIFAEPIDPNDVEEYYEIIKEPMDFGTVRANLLEECMKVLNNLSYWGKKKSWHILKITNNNKNRTGFCLFIMSTRVFISGSQDGFSLNVPPSVDLVYELALRLEPRSLMQMKCLNRSWHRVITTILEDANFAIKHLSHAVPSRTILVFEPSEDLKVNSLPLLRRFGGPFLSRISNVRGSVL